VDAQVDAALAAGALEAAQVAVHHVEVEEQLGRVEGFGRLTERY
jgi:hypothetical protein